MPIVWGSSWAMSAAKEFPQRCSWPSRALCCAPPRITKPPPGACLTYMNQSLAEQHASGMFVTLFYGILNTRTGVLEFSNGGHNPPYVFSMDGRCASSRSVAVRCWASSKASNIRRAPRSWEVTMESWCTPTASPRRATRPDEFFEESRLEAYLTSHASRPVDDLVRNLHAEVERFEAGARRADDITVLALRRRVSPV